MTHPLFAAIDAAIAAHGQPEGVKSMTLHFEEGGTICAVMLGRWLQPETGYGLAQSVVDAHEKALADKAHRDNTAATQARDEMRRLAKLAGVDPNLIPA